MSPSWGSLSFRGYSSIAGGRPRRRAATAASGRVVLNDRPSRRRFAKGVEMTEKNEPTVGNYQRGLEIMARLWGQEVANDMLMFWRSVHPDIERYITAFALGDVWARP